VSGQGSGQGSERADTPADLLSNYNGVLISSEVRKFERSGGNFLYMHPRDPLVRPWEGCMSVMTAAAALGSSGREHGSPKLFLIMASVPVARLARTVITEIHLQLPIGKGVSMTLAPEEVSIEVGPAAAHLKLQQQVNAIMAEPLKWMQDMHKSLVAFRTLI
jgi:hypothetical protein